jgi:hypothetical protein
VIVGGGSVQVGVLSVGSPLQVSQHLSISARCEQRVAKEISDVRSNPGSGPSTAGHGILAHREWPAVRGVDGPRSSRDDWCDGISERARWYGEGGLRSHAGCTFDDPSPVVDALILARVQRRDRNCLPAISGATGVGSEVGLCLTAIPSSWAGMNRERSDGQNKEVLGLHIYGSLDLVRMLPVSTLKDLAKGAPKRKIGMMLGGKWPGRITGK